MIMATKSLSKIHVASFRAPSGQAHRARLLERPCEASPSGLECSSSEQPQLSSPHLDE